MPQGEKKIAKVPNVKKKNTTAKTMNSITKTKKGRLNKPSSNPETQKLQKLEKKMSSTHTKRIEAILSQRLAKDSGKLALVKGNEVQLPKQKKKN